MNDVEEIAQQIASGGREALVERLRPAFERAVAAHADVLEISPEQLDRMVQDAAERADGLQWRRALAGVASDRLGLELGEALRHPAVARAQELLRAPSYEEALGGAAPPYSPPPRQAAAPAAPAAASPAPIPGGATTGAERDLEEEEEGRPEMGEEEAPPATEELTGGVAAESAAGGAAVAGPAEGYGPGEDLGLAEDEDEAGFADGEEGLDRDEDLEPEDEEEEPAEAVPAGPPPSVHIPAIHLGGIANLTPGESGLELRFADPGIDIARDGDAILGRIAWREIKSVDIGSGGRLLRRRKESEAKLVIRTERGDASFRVPGTDEESLRGQLAPALVRIPQQDD